MDSQDNPISGFSDDERELVELLIQAAQAEIHADYERAHSRYRTFLQYLKTNLTSHRLSIRQARNQSGLAGVNSYSVDFKRITGRRPRDYVLYHRLRLAQQIIRHTRSAEIYLIAYAVGYREQSVFSKRYSRQLGSLPSEEPKADHRETRLLIEKLKQSKATTTPSCHHAGDLSVFWEDICELSQEEIAQYLVDKRYEIELQHFDLLLEKARTEGRKSRERGEKLYEVALDTIRVLEISTRKEFIEEKILAYAHLANTRRLRFDLDGAREAFRTIDSIMPRKLTQTTFICISYFRAFYLWWRRDEDSAIRLVEQILPEARSRASHKLLARILRLAGELYDCTGQSKRALPMFEEAVKFAQHVNDSFVAFSAYYALSFLHAKLLNVTKATELLEKVRQLHEDGSRPDSSVYVALLEAMIYKADGNLRSAESCFLEARDGFTALEADIYVALTSLELALLYIELEEPDRAISMAMSSIPCISQFSYHKEAISALAILEEASMSKALNRSIVTQTLHHLELLRADPRIGAVAQ